MPLDNYIPSIDDRRYDDIVAEVRTRIARYTPEWTPVWTDVNDSDPGIAMAQVFAWLSEMMLYRMAKVPDLNYLKFLKLLGMELNPAESAMAEVSFPVREDYALSTLIIPLRTQLSAEPSSAVGEEYSARLGQLLASLSERFHRQYILVTHSHSLASYAEKIYEVEKVNGISQVSVKE